MNVRRIVRRVARGAGPSGVFDGTSAVFADCWGFLAFGSAGFAGGLFPRGDGNLGFSACS